MSAKAPKMLHEFCNWKIVFEGSCAVDRNSLPRLHMFALKGIPRFFVVQYCNGDLSSYTIPVNGNHTQVLGILITNELEGVPARILLKS